MLVRPAPGDDGIEVFMLRRSARSAFAPDVYVFPGGTLDERDMDDEVLARITGIDEPRLVQEFRGRAAPALPAPVAPTSTREAAGLCATALRELFEEAGVLLACDANGTPAVATRPAGARSFASLLRELDLYADARALELFSQWITPPSEPRRYNAHFFVARAQRDQDAAADAHETHDGRWIAPREALDRFAAGSFAMVYPTVKHVERLSAFGSIDELLAFARSKPIYRIMPHTGGERGFALPPELEGAW